MVNDLCNNAYAAGDSLGPQPADRALDHARRPVIVFPRPCLAQAINMLCYRFDANRAESCVNVFDRKSEVDPENETAG
jgi:hypothetical protein